MTSGCRSSLEKRSYTYNQLPPALHQDLLVQVLAMLTAVSCFTYHYITIVYLDHSALASIWMCVCWGGGGAMVGMGLLYKASICTLAALFLDPLSVCLLAVCELWLHAQALGTIAPFPTIAPPPSPPPPHTHTHTHTHTQILANAEILVF